METLKALQAENLELKRQLLPKCLEEYSKGNYLGRLYHDEFAECPLDYEYIDSVKFITLERNTTLNRTALQSVHDVEQFLLANPNWLSFQLYKYEHSGIIYAITPFSCQWDSGQVGYVLVNKSSFKGYDNDQLEEIAHQTCKTITQWLSGDVYHYEIYDTTTMEVIDSCSGVYGSIYGYDEALEILQIDIDGFNKENNRSNQ